MESMTRPPALAKNIQKLRKGKELTLDELAARSGVSKAMLSQIESDKVNPTVATVWKIAHGLGVNFQSLLSGESEPVRRFEVNRAADITGLDTEEGDALVQVLSPITMAEELELYLITVKPRGTMRSSPHYAGTEEFLTVLEGKVKVTAGTNAAELGTGDFISYHCDIEHSITNLSKKAAKIYLVVRFPATGKK